jgi:putative sterol carrier protein
MAYEFGTPEWAHALQQEINTSSEYRSAAGKWGVGFNGNVLLAFEPDAGSQDKPRNLLLRLKAGTCDGVEFIDSSKHPDAGFVLRGPFTLWQEILQRKTLAATAILTGKLKVEGDRMTLLKHTAANRALVYCTASVDTDWK